MAHENFLSTIFSMIDKFFLDALASLKTMFKIKWVRNVFKISRPQSIREFFKVLQSITECYRVLQSIAEYYRILQSITLQSVFSASTWTNFWACFSAYGEQSDSVLRMVWEKCAMVSGRNIILINRMSLWVDSDADMAHYCSLRVVWLDNWQLIRRVFPCLGWYLSFLFPFS